MATFQSTNEYLDALVARASMPEGFLCSTASIEFCPMEKPVSCPFNMNLSLIVAEEETSQFAAMFTNNRFPGAPVIIGKERLARKTMKGVLINNKISNVCAPGGKEDSVALLDALGCELGTPGDSLFPASTGIIGWKLPVREMKEALPGLAKNLKAGSILNVAKAIMTTDSYPKIKQSRIGDGLITGIAKGAGMIEPNLATMLVFILTDVQIPAKEMRDMLAWCVRRSFNRISVDSDQSTSDTVILLGSGKKKLSNPSRFKDALLEVCEGLATDIVRNGEGTNHVIRVNVTGDAEEWILEGIGKAIVNSPLVKTAVFGNDPNVGRIVSSIGDFLGNNHIGLDTGKLSIRMAEREILRANTFKLDLNEEKYLSEYLAQAKLDNSVGYPAHDLYVDIHVETGGNKNTVVVYGSDLSYGYVEENADYRT